MTIQEVLDSKTYVREGSKASEPIEYLEPVLEAFDKLGATVKVSSSKAVENANDDGTVNTSYGRILVEGEFKKYGIESLGSTHKVGFIYALDKNIPEFVSYSGQEIFACTNLCVASDEHVHNFKDNHKQAHKQISDYLVDLDRQRNDIIEFHNKLQSKELSLEDYDTSIGHLLRLALSKYKKIGQSAILHGQKEVLKPGSMYGMVDDSTNMWNVYNSITDFYSKKFKAGGYIYERPLKTKELSKCFTSLLK